MLALLPVAAAVAQTAGPEGFASLDGGTTGGNPANICTAQIVKDDAAATSRNINKAMDCTQRNAKGGVVRFAPANAVARIDKVLKLPSNITLQGPAILENAVIRIRGSRNVIVRDITFRTLSNHKNKYGAACPDPTSPATEGAGDEGTTGCPKTILIQGGGGKGDDGAVQGSRNIWITHNSFDRCADKCIVITSGARDASGRFTGADDVTLSDNIFKNSYLAVLVTYQGTALRPHVGFSTTKCEDVRDRGMDGKKVLPQIRVSVYRNLFTNVRQRNVRASYCTVQVHEFNNVIEGIAREPSAIGAGASCDSKGLIGKGPETVHGAQILFENNYVAAWKNGAPSLNGVTCRNDIVQSGQRNSSVDKPGYIRLVGNVLKNGATSHESEPEKVFTKPPYRYTLLPASEVYATVTRSAGPRPAAR
jgi:pectate lyase